MNHRSKGESSAHLDLLHIWVRLLTNDTSGIFFLSALPLTLSLTILLPSRLPVTVLSLLYLFGLLSSLPFCKTPQPLTYSLPGPAKDTLSLLPQPGTATVRPSARRYVLRAPPTEDPRPALPAGDPWLLLLPGIQLEQLLWRAVWPPAGSLRDALSYSCSHATPRSVS